MFLDIMKDIAKTTKVKRTLLESRMIETSLQYSQEAIIRVKHRAAKNQEAFKNRIPAMTTGAKTSAVRTLLMSIKPLHCAHHNAGPCHENSQLQDRERVHQNLATMFCKSRIHCKQYPTAKSCLA